MAPPPTRICVFCPTTTGKAPAHLEAARDLARILHANNIDLVYGGGTTGLTGELAKTLLSIERPEDAVVADEASRGGWLGKFKGMFGGKRNNATASALLSETIYGRTTVVADVQIRKKVMCEEVNTGGPGSGFIGLSGGFGTMDELMEMVTWNQLGVHNRRVCLLNIDGYWDNVMGWVEAAIEAGFVRVEARKMFVERETPEECVEWLMDYQKQRGR